MVEDCERYDSEQYDRELEARLNAWQQTMARREESETLSEGEAERQAAAMQVASNRVDPLFFSSDEEDASSPARKRSEPLTAFEAEEEVRRSSQRERDAFVAAVDKAASIMMSTPVSAPAQSPFIQTQLSPIASEEEFTYDSDAEREGRHRDSDSPPPPYDADTELAEYTAMSDKLRAEAEGARDAHVSSPSSAFARRHSGSGSLRTRSAASDEETLDAHSPGRGEWSACREILLEQLRSAARRQPVPEHRVGGSDGESVRSVMVDAENLVRSFHRSAQETATKALQAPFATISAVAFDYFQSVQGFRQKLLASGLAADPGILGTGIMRPDITPEQIMTKPLFANALRKQNAAKEENRRKLHD